MATLVGSSPLGVINEPNVLSPAISAAAPVGSVNGDGIYNNIAQVYDINSDATNASTSIKYLLAGGKWGGGLGNPANLTYSFSKLSSFYSYSSQEAVAANIFEFSTSQKTGMRNALANFAQIAGLVFTEVSDTATSAGDLRAGNSPTSIMPTAAAYNPYGHPSAGDMFFGGSGVSPLNNGYDYQTMLHELGHALGLKHTHNGTEAGTVLDQLKYTVMSYRSYQGAGEGYSNSFYPTTLMLNDIQAIQYLYGANTTYKTGNDSYTWNSDSSIFETIYDAGGSDTINASSQTIAVKINLNAGQWSEIGKAFNRGDGKMVRDCLTIAYGCTIESAIGSAYNDTLIGNEANNFLNGAAGADSMEGGLGDDNYYIDNTNDIVVESGNQGSDRINTTVSYTLSANIENARALGTDNTNLIGNALDNTIYAGEGNNILNGAGGIDAVSFFYSTSGVSANLNTNQSTGFGTDTLQNFEQLYGSLFNDTLIGSIGNDSLYGLDGNDQLNGYAGADYMSGGLGDDNYQVDNTSDIVVESVNQGSDRINTTVSYTLSANIENARALGMSNINLTGNALSNIIYAGEGSNVLNGADGTDAVSYFYATNAVNANLNTGQSTGFGTDTLQNIEQLYGSLFNDTLTGSIGNDSLYGLDGNDILSGSKGVDYMTGALGDDTYLFGSGDGSDVLAESGGNNDILSFNTNITSSQLWFQQSTNNLIISVIGTADKITIVNWYSNTANQVEEIQASDGKVLSNIGVQALVSAMSAFSPPTSGQTTLPTSYQTALTPALAANWG